MKTLSKMLMLLWCAALMVSCKDKTEIRKIESSYNIDIDYSPDDYPPGDTIYGSHHYVRMIVGDLESPIILSSPHDGTLSVPDSVIPVRTHPSAVVVRDLYVTDLVLKMADSLKKLTGFRPHVIINDLPRAKMEPNRALADAYMKSKVADTAWIEYHNFLKIARKIVKEHVGKGLYLDMHGHGHNKDRIEVGYLLRSADLNNPDASIDYMASKTSIASVGKHSTHPFSQLINGDVAFGTLLANHGCDAVPSKQIPRPFDDEYFDGGYCTLTYGSKDSGDDISAIQLETHGPNLRNTADQRTASAGKIARAIIDYFKYNYNMDLMK